MIWCDLDNTLIWTWEPLITSPLLSAAFGLPIEHEPPRGPGRRKLTRIEVPALGAGYACRRKSAVRFLRELRRVERAKMLTSALRCYAVAMNATFGLGFQPDDIVTREDLNVEGPMGSDPQAVLIDNAPPFRGDDHHHSARLKKLRYLGTTSKTVVEIPYFGGEVRDPFENHWRRYVARIRSLAEEARV